MVNADLLAMIHAFLDHGRYLRANHTKLNWLTMEMSGLYTVGAEFPEFKDAADWRQFAAATLAEQDREQFLPDGGQVELSTSYQDVALDNFLHIAEVARWTGNTENLPSDYIAPLQKAYEWQLDLVAPDRHLPRVNDSGSVYLPDVMKKAIRTSPTGRTFVGSRAVDEPARRLIFSFIFLDRSGMAAMRSVGRPTQTTFCFDRTIGHESPAPGFTWREYVGLWAGVDLRWGRR